jgi:adenosine deaminase
MHTTPLTLPTEFATSPYSDALPLRMQRTILARRMPKAELHCHLQGALRPSQFEQLVSARSTNHRADPAAYDFRTFTKFFDDLDRFAALWGDKASLVLATLDVLGSMYDAGAVRVELMLTPELHRRAVGVDNTTLLEAVAEGFRIAEDLWDLSGGIVVEMHRSDGGTAALQLVEETLALAERGLPVLGYGNDGDHHQVDFDELAPAYMLARSAGMGLCGHAANVADVERALDLGLDRIDHGFFAASSPSTLQRLAESGTPLVVCPTSGVLAVGPAFFDALTVLSDAGVPLVLGTDDPPLFFTDLVQEYITFGEEYELSSDELVNTAATSITAAWYGPSGQDHRLRDLDLLESHRRNVLAPERVR